MREWQRAAAAAVFAFGVCKVEALYKKIAHRDGSKIADVKKNLAEQRPGCEKQVGNVVEQHSQNGQIFDCVAV